MLLRVCASEEERVQRNRSEAGSVRFRRAEGGDDRNPGSCGVYEEATAGVGYRLGGRHSCDCTWSCVSPRGLDGDVLNVSSSSNLQADEQGRAVWLVTSDAVGFYEAVGYTKAREQWIGTSNPAWDGPPVPVRIVSLSVQLTP